MSVWFMQERSCDRPGGRPQRVSLPLDASYNTRQTMLFKIIALIAAAIPIVLFVRAMLFRRPTRISEGVKEFKKQVDFAVWLFLVLVGLVVAAAAVKLAWTWWSAT
jgi:hypothetical protein